MHEVTLCEMCGEDAIARVRQEWLCARCGLHRTTVQAGIDSTAGATAGSASRWRGAVRAAIGSGLAARVLIGAAALAAVGGAVVTDAPPSHPPPSSPPPVATPVGPPDAAVPGTLPGSASDTARPAPHPYGLSPDPVQSQEHGPVASAAGGMSAAAAQFVDAVQWWNECLDLQVRGVASLPPEERAGFEPFGVCGGPPDPAGFGLPAHGRPDGVGRPDDAGRPDDQGGQANENA